MKRKNKLYLYSLLLVVCLVVISILLIYTWKKRNSSFPPHLKPTTPVSGSLTVNINEKDLIFSAKEDYYRAYSLKAGLEYEIEVKQNEKDFSDTKLFIKTEEENLLIPLENKESFKFQFEKKGKLEISVLTYSKKEKKHIFYVSNFFHLEEIKKHSKELQDLSIVLVQNISTKDDIIFTSPLDLYLNFYTLKTNGQLIVNFQEEGNFNFYLTREDQLRVKAFYADAPNANIKTQISFFDQDPNYCIRAKTFNGIKLKDEISVNTPKDFIQLLDDNAYPLLYPNSILSIQDMTISQKDALAYYKKETPNIKMSKGADLNFEGSFILQDIGLVIESYNEDEIRINHKDKADISLDKIFIDAPYSALVWVNKPPSMDYILNHMNLKFYQGIELTDKLLGGEGRDKILAFVSNSNTSLNWIIKGNTIETTIPYSLNESSLENMEISIDKTGGKVKIAGKEINNKINLRQRPIITLEDEEGRRRNYKIIVRRQKHKLPQIFIDVKDGKKISSNIDYLLATFTMDADHLNSSLSLGPAQVDIRGRGNSTWRLFDKTPYRLKFHEQVSIMGLKKNRDWILLANYSDQSLIRNHIALEMGKRLDHLKFTPSSYLVDLFVNGEYVGVYSIGEQIEVAKSRLDIDLDYSDVNTGYLLEVGGKKDGMVLNWDYFHASNLKWITIKSPKTSLMTQDHYNYISDYMKKADRAIINLNNYEEYVDIDSVIDWVIIHEFTCNLDSGFRRSCFFYKEKDGKLFMGPIWDFDLAFGNYTRDISYDHWFTNGGETLKETWTTYLFQDPAFNIKFKARWNQVKEDLKKTALDTINSAMPTLATSANENFLRWPDLLANRTTLQPRHMKDLRTHKEHIDYIKNFLNDRYDWLDLEINGLP